MGYSDMSSTVVNRTLKMPDQGKESKDPRNAMSHESNMELYDCLQDEKEALKLFLFKQNGVM